MCHSHHSHPSGTGMEQLMLVIKLRRCPVCFPCLAVAVCFGEMLFSERGSSLIYCCSSKSNGIPICAIHFSADFQILLWDNLELIFQIQRLVPKFQYISALEIKTCLACIKIVVKHILYVSFYFC